jgi:hypothetical protein
MFRIFVNGKVQAYAENCDLKSPLKGVEGLQLLDGLKGEFTEIRLWSTNLNLAIISEAY